MSRELRDRQLLLFCAALDAVEPTSPTLCDGWDAHHLALHVWQLKHDPLAWPGVALARFASTTAARAARRRRRQSYGNLVSTLRTEGGGIAAMPMDALEGHRHALGEYYVHTQDVLRANGLRTEQPGLDLEHALWLRAGRAAGILHRRRPGLILRWPGVGDHRVTRGAPGTIVTGLPSEVILWVYGRTTVADVEATEAGRSERP